ncbi:hypothetical protein RSOLAG22IIIB_12453 [Rhizoctonia solani]|uniref:Uncharacterized protein n=1 Tax=Rhizoctonia solani TaxID=456999 RepID=A0A0K6GEE1_9AGAM|nr:hypothetical protein RSOLAG22IIIB_12453 [Rhizoctonia solani]
MTDDTTFYRELLPERGRDYMSLGLNRAPSAAGPLIHQPGISRDPAVSGSQCQSVPSIDELLSEYPHMVLGAPSPVPPTILDAVAEAAMILQLTHPELLELANSIPVTAEALDLALDPAAYPALTAGPTPQLAGHGYSQPVTDFQSEQEPHNKRKRTSSVMYVDSNQGPSCKRTKSQAKFVPEKKEGSTLWSMFYSYSRAYRFELPNIADRVKQHACLYTNPFDGTQCWTKKYDAQLDIWLRYVSGWKETGFLPRHIGEYLRHLAVHRQAEASAVKDLPELAHLATRWNDELIDAQIIRDRDVPDEQRWYPGEKLKSREELVELLNASGYNLR